MTRTAFFATLFTPFLAPFIPKRETKSVDSAETYYYKVSSNLRGSDMLKFIERAEKQRERFH